MLQVVKDTSGTLTASQVVERVGGSKDHRWEAFNELKGTHIDVRKVTRLEGKRDVERDLAFLRSLRGGRPVRGQLVRHGSDRFS